MPSSDRHPSAERGARLFRFMAALSVIIALVAIVTVANGDHSGKSRALIVAAMALGACALAGMAALTLSYAHRRKDRK